MSGPLVEPALGTVEGLPIPVKSGFSESPMPAADQSASLPGKKAPGSSRHWMFSQRHLPHSCRETTHWVSPLKGVGLPGRHRSCPKGDLDSAAPGGGTVASADRAHPG